MVASRSSTARSSRADTLGAVRHPGRALESQTDSEQPLDHEVVQVATDAVAVLEDRKAALVVTCPWPPASPTRPARRSWRGDRGRPRSGGRRAPRVQARTSTPRPRRGAQHRRAEPWSPAMSHVRATAVGGDIVAGGARVRAPRRTRESSPREASTSTSRPRHRLDVQGVESVPVTIQATSAPGDLPRAVRHRLQRLVGRRRVGQQRGDRGSGVQPRRPPGRPPRRGVRSRSRHPPPQPGRRRSPRPRR